MSQDVGDSPLADRSFQSKTSVSAGVQAETIGTQSPVPCILIKVPLLRLRNDGHECQLLKPKRLGPLALLRPPGKGRGRAESRSPSLVFELTTPTLSREPHRLQLHRVEFLLCRSARQCPRSSAAPESWQTTAMTTRCTLKALSVVNQSHHPPA